MTERWRIRQIPIERLDEPELAVRIEDNLEGIAALADSLREQGLLQPILVREREDGRYQLVAGRRRTLAAQQLGWSTIAARILDEAVDSDLVTVTENLQREDLGPMEEALAFETILTRTGMTQERLASGLGIKREYVAKRMMLLKLDDNTASAVHDGTINVSAALELGRIDDLRTRQYYVQHAQQYGSPVSTIHYWVENWLAAQGQEQASGVEQVEQPLAPPPREAEMRCFACESLTPMSMIVSVALCKSCVRELETVAAGRPVDSAH